MIAFEAGTLGDRDDALVARWGDAAPPFINGDDDRLRLIANRCTSQIYARGSPKPVCLPVLILKIPDTSLYN